MNRFWKEFFGTIWYIIRGLAYAAFLIVVYSLGAIGSGLDD